MASHSKPMLAAALTAWILGGTAMTATPAQPRTPNQVLDHHDEALRRGNLEQVMADYAEDAIAIVAPAMMEPRRAEQGPAVLAGKEQVRSLFALYTDARHRANSSHMETTRHVIAGGAVVMHWVIYRGTPQEAAGDDVFIIRGGKIRFQDIQAPRGHI